jgi:2-polyprenyl-6-hydroxyphenyl methylase / 3-demethylubiquinone-9 3-methyltransferase
MGAHKVLSRGRTLDTRPVVYFAPVIVLKRWLDVERYQVHRYRRVILWMDSIPRVRANILYSQCSTDASVRSLSTNLLDYYTEGGFEIGVNTEIYQELGERWYTANDDPVALLRAESRARNDWIAGEIQKAFPDGPPRVLDIGCGAGFLSNDLARRGLLVAGLDTSERSLAVAKQHDKTDSVSYELGDAYRLPCPAAAFEVVCALDFLEHVAEPARVIKEIARVLKPRGQFFFSTFNRNLLSYLVVIKGVEWFVKNTPRDLHVLKLFIKPSELRAMCAGNGLSITAISGFGPKINQRAFWRMLRTGIVADDFEFVFKKSTLMGYLGLAVK